MPLKHGYSKKTWWKNVREMRRHGHPIKQSFAAAYREAKQSAKRAHARPAWLKPKPR